MLTLKGLASNVNTFAEPICLQQYVDMNPRPVPISNTISSSASLAFTIFISPSSYLPLIIFNASTKENQKITNEWVRRSHLGLARAELLTPNLYSPLPGLLTGMFFSTDGQTLYIANLGNDLLKLNYH